MRYVCKIGSFCLHYVTKSLLLGAIVGEFLVEVAGDLFDVS